MLLLHRLTDSSLLEELTAGGGGVADQGTTWLSPSSSPPTSSSSSSPTTLSSSSSKSSSVSISSSLPPSPSSPSPPLIFVPPTQFSHMETVLSSLGPEVLDQSSVTPHVHNLHSVSGNATGERGCGALAYYYIRFAALVTPNPVWFQFHYCFGMMNKFAMGSSEDDIVASCKNPAKMIPQYLCHHLYLLETQPLQERRPTNPRSHRFVESNAHPRTKANATQLRFRIGSNSRRTSYLELKKNAGQVEPEITDLGLTVEWN